MCTPQQATSKLLKLLKMLLFIVNLSKDIVTELIRKYAEERQMCEITFSYYEAHTLGNKHLLCVN